MTESTMTDTEPQNLGGITEGKNVSADPTVTQVVPKDKPAISQPGATSVSTDREPTIPSEEPEKVSPDPTVGTRPQQESRKRGDPPEPEQTLEEFVKQNELSPEEFALASVRGGAKKDTVREILQDKYGLPKEEVDSLLQKAEEALQPQNQGREQDADVKPAPEEDQEVEETYQELKELYGRVTEGGENAPTQKEIDTVLENVHRKKKTWKSIALKVGVGGALGGLLAFLVLFSWHGKST